MQPAIETTEAKTITRIIPARIVLDVDEQTGQEFAYEYKASLGEWLNLTNEKYYSDEFVQRLELDVLHVEFAGETMKGAEWREQGSPRFVKVQNQR